MAAWWTSSTARRSWTWRSRSLQVCAHRLALAWLVCWCLHSSLVDLIDCPPQLDLAVEVTASVRA